MNKWKAKISKKRFYNTMDKHIEKLYDYAIKDKSKIVFRDLGQINMLPKMIKHNEIKIKHESSIIFGEDNINISIKNTSFGALRMFTKELKELAIKRYKLRYDPVTSAYADLLKKLSKELDIKLLDT